jgi:hypothetical protein
MLYSRFCIKKMGIPLTLIILQQLDTIPASLTVDKSKENGDNNKVRLAGILDEPTSL